MANYLNTEGVGQLGKSCKRYYKCIFFLIIATNNSFVTTYMFSKYTQTERGNK